MNLFKIYGNIGCGKSTLTEMLAEELGGILWIEPFEDNPFLSLFYGEMANIKEGQHNKYALPLQLYFLTLYISQNNSILEQQNPLNIQDGGAFSGYAYTKTQFRKGMISQYEYDYFTTLFKVLRKSLDINYTTYYLNLDPQEALSRIEKRASEDQTRSQENTIPLGYLEMLDSCYKETFAELDIPVEYIDINGMSLQEEKELFTNFISKMLV